MNIFSGTLQGAPPRGKQVPHVSSGTWEAAILYERVQHTDVLNADAEMRLYVHTVAKATSDEFRGLVMEALLKAHSAFLLECVRKGCIPDKTPADIIVRVTRESLGLAWEEEMTERLRAQQDELLQEFNKWAQKTANPRLVLFQLIRMFRIFELRFEAR